eukprot:scaffold3436_cov129-Isochrysis_galbana.AAC.3
MGAHTHKIHKGQASGALRGRRQARTRHAARRPPRGPGAQCQWSNASVAPLVASAACTGSLWRAEGRVPWPHDARSTRTDASAVPGSISTARQSAGYDGMRRGS